MVGRGLEQVAEQALGDRRIRIGVVAPASRMSPEVPDKVIALAQRQYGERAPDIVFHPQCLLERGHFAGDDGERAAAFIEVANDPTFDVLWCARGGYGANRIAEYVLPALTEAAKVKTYLGYSDFGFLLAPLHKAGIGTSIHGPVAQEILRDGGEAAIDRVLSWLVDRNPAALEPSLAAEPKAVAFNITVLSQMLGTPFQPDLAGQVLMLEEVSEALYRIDRSLFHITSNPGIRRCAGIRLGRCSLIPENDPDFGMEAEQVARFWCERSQIPWLGRADIGHDADNKLVPFAAA
jgi:muramoyltetrapeptide carboxypeptidase